jgi:putative sterol carrier protein
VVKFLTDAWVSALDRSATTQISPIDGPFVIEYRVVDESADAFVYQVRFDLGTVTVTSGANTAPTVVLSTDRTTAQRIATNEVSAQAAFMAGHLRLDGDTMALVRNHDALARLDDIFAGVRSRTEY